jgi:YbgC/YbaW family acyl-CoA thioester hydrolase
MYEFRTSRKIEFADTDMGGIVHFSRFVVFMETAEHEFLNALGTSVAMDHDGVHVGWPRVKVSCEYKRPARFGDVLDIHVRVLRKGRRSLTYGFVFRCRDEEIAFGEMTAVCCILEPGKKVRAIPIPSAIDEKIEEAPD